MSCRVSASVGQPEVVASVVLPGEVSSRVDEFDQINSVALQSGVATAVVQSVATVASAVAGLAAKLSWAVLVTERDEGTLPELLETISAGAVWSYVRQGVTRFRLIPVPYSESADAFYAQFESSTLSYLVAARST